MKQFFQKHSYDMVKMFLNQFATAMFGFVLAFATSKNPTFRNVVGVFSVAFYLFLLYVMTWELGYKDKNPSEQGRIKRNVFTGTLISVCANVINWIFALFIMLAQLLPQSWISDVGGICATGALLLEGTYTGLLANYFHGAPLNSYWLVYYLLPIPAVLTCTLAYNLGLRDIKFTRLFNQVYPDSDRDPKEKRK